MSDGPAAGLREDFGILCAAVREAASVALGYFGSPVESWEKAPGHPVSEADLAVEAILRERLLEARPTYGWLCEETPDDGRRHNHDRLWVVDPIDGTRAFLRAIPEFAVCVALVERGRALAGAVANPAAGMIVEAVAGGGARCNGMSVSMRPPRPLERALLLASAASMHKAAGPMAGTTFRRVNSIAWRMALVAAGQADGCISLQPKSDWDLAAAEVLVREAGGAVTGLDGGELRYNRESIRHSGCIAAAPALHAVLLERVGRPA